MDTFLFFPLGFGYLCLLIWGLFLARRHGLLNLTNVLLLVILGLIYDNFVIAFGKYIGEGDLLEELSYVRFWLHALLTPTLVLFAWSICFRIGLPWANKTFYKVFVYLITIGLILYELLTSIRGLELEPNWRIDVLTYENAFQSGNPVMVILITLVLGIVGFILMRKFHFSWLFIGTLIVILGSILAIWIKSFPIMNVLEFLFIISLLMTKQFQLKWQESH